MIKLVSTSLVAAALGLGLTLAANSAFAGVDCHKFPNDPSCKPPPTPKKVLCHNIGGPRDLGANCEATGNCTFILENGDTVTFPDDTNFFLGIVVGATSAGAIAAHIAHGDGYAIGPVYDPPLHLASVVGPHQASNVECFAERVIPQVGEPNEPGN